MNYATPQQLHLWFGQNNLDRWSSLEPDDPDPDPERISAAIDSASRTIDDRLRSSPYRLPLARIIDHQPPRSINEICMMLAAAWLLESRSLAGLDAHTTTATVDRLRTRANERLDRIASGTEQLDAWLNRPINHRSPRGPEAINA